MTTAAILLAGGESSRMGTPKPLLQWGGQTLVEYQIEELRQAGADPVIVVLGHRADEVLPLARKAGAYSIINELYGEGRAASLRVGAAALGDETETIVVLNVDQPRPRWVTARLLNRHHQGASLITLPTSGGRRGHPAVVSAALLPELRDLRERTQGLRAVIERHEGGVLEVPFEEDVVLLGINTPAEYEQARRSYFQHAQRAGQSGAEVQP